MGKLEKNGIVELDDIFSIGPVDDVYNREEDILPINGNEPAKKDEKPVEEGSQLKKSWLLILLLILKRIKKEKRM